MCNTCGNPKNLFCLHTKTRRYSKPTVTRISMATVKEHNWLTRVAPLMYRDWMEVGRRLIKELSK